LTPLVTLDYLFHIFVQAIERRDAIAKFIYASLFNWLLDQVNKSLEVGKKCTWKSISILDLYGFQTFQVSSLYQCAYLGFKECYVLKVSCITFSEKWF